MLTSESGTEPARSVTNLGCQPSEGHQTSLTPVIEVMEWSERDPELSCCFLAATCVSDARDLFSDPTHCAELRHQLIPHRFGEARGISGQLAKCRLERLRTVRRRKLGPAAHRGVSNPRGPDEPLPDLPLSDDRIRRHRARRSRRAVHRRLRRPSPRSSTGGTGSSRHVCPCLDASGLLASRPTYASFTAAASGAPAPSGLSADEKVAYERLQFVYQKGIGYGYQMRLRPRTLYGIADSPVGLADARNYEMISRVFKGESEGLTRDDIALVILRRVVFALQFHRWLFADFRDSIARPRLSYLIGARRNAAQSDRGQRKRS
jgi:hypothetical protein